MAKKTDRNLPAEIKPIWDLINGFLYRQDYSRVFECMLDSIINMATLDKTLHEEAKKSWEIFKDKEREAMCQIVREVFILQNKMIVEQEKPWYDPFGTIYEFITSAHKSSAMGQFFTPQPVVDLLVACTIMADKDYKKQSGKKIMEPSAGSGRMIIASHAVNPKNLHYAIDTDYLCCKMTVCNMFLHGCKGEVIWKNALSLASWRKGWGINLNGLGITVLKKEDSFIYQRDKEDYFKHARAEKGKSLEMQFLEDSSKH